MILGLLVTAAFARGDVAPIQVRAAEEAARYDLRNQILAVQIAPGVSVRDLSDQNPGALRVDQMVDAARPVGGLRWIERDVVQVQLQVPAAQLMERLAAIPPAERDPRVTPRELERLNRDWARRSFSATGQAIPPARLASLVTMVSAPNWQSVGPADRAATAQKAHSAAAVSIVDRGSAIQTEGRVTLADRFSVPEARRKLIDWASSLPATRVTLNSDRQMEVSLYVDKEGLGSQLQSMLPPELMNESKNREALAAGVAAMPVIMIGRAEVTAADAPHPRGGFSIPVIQRDQPINAEASSPLVQNRLRTARIAEAAARAALLEKLRALPLEDGRSLAQALEQDPPRMERLQTVADRARVYQVDYQADGSATVKVTVDPAELADELFSRR
ncbi:MAG TPA: hypothetical protein VGB55_09525 [Tepidisphaeraceae bacterium]|jgi:hypothetical protein